MSSAEAWQQEKEFLDYMFVSLHGGGGEETESSRAGSSSRRSAGQQQISCHSIAAPVPISSNKSPVKTEAPAGLDHLDNLCKLMEQLGELRDANSRLQKRVQYLEDMKTLQEMHQELDMFVGSDSTAETSVHGKAETGGADRSLDSLDSGEIVQQAEPVKSEDPGRNSGKKGKSHNHHHHMKFHKKSSNLLKYRERSKSVGFDENVPLGSTSGENNNQQVDYNASPTTTPSPDSYKLPETTTTTIPASPRGAAGSHHPVGVIRTKTKVSKWTRVKEAFRWEKAHVDPAATTVKARSSKHPPDRMKEEALSSRHQVRQHNNTLAPDESLVGHHVKSPSPVFRLGRRRRSNSRTSTSSSSLSECPLESEILKSFADAQELPRKLLISMATR